MKSLLLKIVTLSVLATQAMSQELNSTLHSTLYGVQFAFVDEMVIFTCVVKESNSMAWTSDEYIGIGGEQLQFSAADPPRTSRTAIGNNQTVATLINAMLDQFIVSQLRIRIKSIHPTAAVQCRNTGANTALVTSTTFLLADMASVTCDKQSVCLGETMTCVCMTGNSNTLAWMIEGSRLEFSADDPPLTRRNVSGSSTTAVLTENSDTNRVRVIGSNLTLSVSMISKFNDPVIILRCVNVDRAMMKPVILPITDKCPMASSNQVSTPAESKPQMDSCSGPITAAVVPVIIILIVLLIVISVAIVLLYAFKHRPLQQEYNQKVEECQKKNKEITDRDKEIEALKREKAKIESELNEKDTQYHEVLVNISRLTL